MSEYFGKYRGIVTDVDNSQGMLKIRANVPKLLGGYSTGWALPCLSFTANDFAVGFTPSKGDTVWIEFEQGDLGYPIWTGGWFKQGEAPDFKGVKINGTVVEFESDGVVVHGNVTVDGSIVTVGS